MAEDYNLTTLDDVLNSTTESVPTKQAKHHLTWEDLSLAVLLCVFIIITVVSNSISYIFDKVFALPNIGPKCFHRVPYNYNRFESLMKF